MTRPPVPDGRPFAAVILGADAVLAALPSTPVQLAHACMAAGFDMAYPASWGDELVAAECLERLGPGGPEPAILCACQHVFDRITRAGSELAPWMVRLPAPPVAAARYLRALHAGHALRITFVGSCPSASDPVIDAQLSPAELLASFAARGVVLDAQPRIFDSILPPDRRRYYSVPGGAPSPDRLDELVPPRALVEPEGGDVMLEMAQHMLSRRDVLIDVAPRMGCACSGALMSSPSHGARTALVELDPPRAGTPVIERVPSVQADDTGARPEPRPPADAAGAPSAVPPPREPSAGVHVRDRGPLPLVRIARPRDMPVVRARDGRTIARAYTRFRNRARDDEPSYEPPPARPPQRTPPPARTLLEFSAAD